MITEKGLKSIFESYGIKHVKLVKNQNEYDFIISSMEKSISLDNWQNLENVLKDVLGKDIEIMTEPQAIKYLKSDYFSKEEIIL